MLSSVAASIIGRSIGACWPLCGAAEQDVLEELARSSSCAAVDVSGYAFFQDEPGVLQDGGVEILRVVHDDQHAPRVLGQRRDRRQQKERDSHSQ